MGVWFRAFKVQGLGVFSGYKAYKLRVYGLALSTGLGVRIQ